MQCVTHSSFIAYHIRTFSKSIFKFRIYKMKKRTALSKAVAEPKKLPEEKKESQQEDSTNYVITKFLRRGFNSLSTEELAATMITPGFPAVFKAKTGEDWDTQYKVKVLDRLENAKFDLRWLTKSTTLNGQFGPLFELCKLGSVSKVVEYIKKNGNDTLFAVDVAMKSPLHIAASNGHTQLVETLVNMGASLEARDKFLRTPLHLAASGGFETVGNSLISLGADPSVKDSVYLQRDAKISQSGRTALHYACCASSVELVNLLIAKCPELVHMADNVLFLVKNKMQHSRTPLHYVVWNESTQQASIARALAENGAEIDSMDEARRTPLHYASEVGKTKVLPVLLQHGAKISLRDGEKNMTAFQLAPNERVREILIVYSSPPHKTKPEDIAYLNEALKGQKLLIRVAEEPKRPSIKQPRVQRKPSREVSHELPKEPPRVEQSEPEDLSPGALPYNLKNHQELLINLLGRVQEFGVASSQHIKKPYLFSGSWMEQVRSIEDLMKIIGGTTPSDAVMRVYNILYPYKKPLPPAKGDELAVSEFYGEKLVEGEMDKAFKSPEKAPEPVHEGAESKEMEKYIAKLEGEMKEKERKIKELEAKVLEKQKPIEDESTKILLAQEKGEKEALEGRVQELNNELLKAQNQVEELQEILSQTNEKYVELKNQIEAPDNADLEAANKKIAELEKQLELQKQMDKALRFKAGQMFLACLEEANGKLAGSKVTSEEQKYGDELDNFDPADDYALIRLLKKLEGNPPNLHQRLLNADNTGTGILTLSQYTKVLESLQIPPQDVMSMLRLVKAFENGTGKFRIREFMSHLNHRAELREKWENALFTRVLSYFKQTGLSLTDAFAFFDVNQNGQIEFEEMSAAFNAMKIRLPRQDLKAIFAVMDKDGSGEVSLEEFEEKLLAVGGAELKKVEKEEEKQEENDVIVDEPVGEEQEEIDEPENIVVVDEDTMKGKVEEDHPQDFADSLKVNNLEEAKEAENFAPEGLEEAKDELGQEGDSLAQNQDAAIDTVPENKENVDKQGDVVINEDIQDILQFSLYLDFKQQQ
eukprot:TRINITY_DN1213_c0_g1_i1.p1 TRINITY_DN1213_c0_g1~~TRINITY_DN1213_c0_g1_i1.p1  ORF type:complete len:1048 (+),score=177.28 TRINITY_DN1213_c0_g1_i1:4476-7619(+)